MPVIWTGPGHRYPSIGYAVPCPTCNAEIGDQCMTHVHPIEPGSRTVHAARYDRAAALGFVMAVMAPRGTKSAAS